MTTKTADSHTESELLITLESFAVLLANSALCRTIEDLKKDLGKTPFIVSSLLLAWLPSLAATAAVTGVSALAVGVWRTYRKRPLGTTSGPVLGSFGLLLMLIGWTGYAKYHASHKGRLDYCRSTLVKGIATALDMYATDHKGQLPTALSELTPTYLKYLPECPTAGRETYSETYRRLQTSEGLGYRVSCGGRNHCGAGVSSADMPTFHSKIGSYCDDHVPLRKDRFLQQSR